VSTPARQNVTLSIPRDLVREAKVVAARRGTSLSALMVEGLRRTVRDEEHVARAARRIRRRLRLDLGTWGRPLPSRASLHER
jgi:hypothetical protein